MKFISEENYNNLRKDKQLNYLDKYIKSGQSKDKFKLFTNEVGKGKSVLTSFSMIEGYLNNDIKYLYVVKNNQLAKEAEDRINTYCKTKGLTDLSIFINSENKRKQFKNISKYPILIITHARYKICCIDKRQKKEIIKLKNMLKETKADKLMDIKDIDGLFLTKKNIINECDIVDNFYTHTTYFECNNLYTYDNRYDFWLLDNNILLDASGLFLYTYKL